MMPGDRVSGLLTFDLENESKTAEVHFRVVFRSGDKNLISSYSFMLFTKKPKVIDLRNGSTFKQTPL